MECCCISVGGNVCILQQMIDRLILDRLCCEGTLLRVIAELRLMFMAEADNHRVTGKNIAYTVRGVEVELFIWACIER